MIAIENKTNGVKLFVAVMAIFVAIAGVGIVMTDNGVDAADTGTQYYGGDLLNGATQSFDDVNVVIDKNLTISGTGSALTVTGGNFTINEGVEVIIENGGQLIIDGKGLITINGSVTINGDGSIFDVCNDGGDSVSVEVVESSVLYKDYGVVVNGSIQVINKGTIKATGDIKVGESEAAPSILLNKNATMNIFKSKGDVGSIVGINVDIAVGGSFTFNGNTDGTGFEVSAYGTGDYTTFGKAKITSNTTTDTNYSDVTFTVSSKNVTGYVPSGDTITTQTVKQYNLNLSGSIATGDCVTFSGDGTTTTYYTSEEYANAYSTTAPTAINAVIYDALVLPQTIISDLNVKAGGSVVIENNSSIQNNLAVFVTGSMSLGYSESTAGTIQIGGILRIQGTMSASDGSCLDDTNAGIIVIDGGSATMKNPVNPKVQLYGAYYIDESGTDEIMYITDLASAISGAKAINQSDVQLWAAADSEDNKGLGGYIISSDLIIPEGIDLTINSATIINEGVTVTIESGASINFGSTIGESSKGIFVNGKLIDNDTGVASSKMVFEVMIETENGNDMIYTYCSLKTALAETSSGTIYLYGSVIIDGTLTIPENVTVTFIDDDKYADSTISFKNENSTLVINGILSLDNNKRLATSPGKVTVNNVLVSEEEITVETFTNIAGAYFSANLDDNGDKYYITSAAFAATNSQNVDGNITIYGKVSMGDVTFTKGEDVSSLTITIQNNDKDIATGNVTIVGNVKFSTSNGTFTGSVQSDVTAGTTIIDLDKVKGAVIGYSAVESVDSTNTYMTLTGETTGSTGAISITSGSVNVIGNDVNFEKIAVASSATMVVPTGSKVTVTTPLMGEFTDYVSNAGVPAGDDAQKAAIKAIFAALGIDNNLPVFTDERMQALAGLVVNGNVVINGDLTSLVAYIDGTLSAEDNSVLYFEIAQIDGTVTTATDSVSSYTIAIINGTLSGKYAAGATLTYPGSDITDALINSTDGEMSTDDVTTIYVNGTEYATIYAQENSNLPVMTILMFTDVVGVDIDTAKFYTDAEMTNQIKDMDANAVTEAYSNLIDAMRNATGGQAALETFIATLTGAVVGDYDNIYISMDPSKVTGIITVYSGMNLYIDGKSLENFMVYNEATKSYEYVLSVGTHQFSVQVNPGLSGTPVVTLDGQTVTDSFTIADNAQSFQIVVSGDISQDSTVVVDGGNTGGDSGMGLTDYLLIILVILIVIMAIMVAFRLMRS